jgi:hypothetical protein
MKSRSLSARAARTLGHMLILRACQIHAWRAQMLFRGRLWPRTGARTQPPVPSSVTSPAGRHYDPPVFSYEPSDLK